MFTLYFVRLLKNLKMFQELNTSLYHVQLNVLVQNPVLQHLDFLQTLIQLLNLDLHELVVLDLLVLFLKSHIIDYLQIRN